jgi:hypothetical protein
MYPSAVQDELAMTAPDAPGWLFHVMVVSPHVSSAARRTSTPSGQLLAFVAYIRNVAALTSAEVGREGTLNRTYEILMLLRIRGVVELLWRIPREVESPRLTSGLLEATNASASAGIVVVAAGAAGRLATIGYATIRNAAAALPDALKPPTLPSAELTKATAVASA